MSIDFSLFSNALDHRTSLLSSLHSEQTDSYRLFHGAAEGIPGLTIDRYGSLLLMQTFREGIEADEVASIEEWYRSNVDSISHFVYNHRKKDKGSSFEMWHEPTQEATAIMECHELGVTYLNQARHRGIDPLFFLDFRVVRRWLREHSKGKTLLNLFSYTSTAGICAAVSGAREVWNVDFASTSLEWGRRSAALNDVASCSIEWVQEDVFPVIRQLAGLALRSRARKRPYQHFSPQLFDIVILDPPTWAKSRWGAVDIVNDYQSLFKPALLSVAEGGVLIASNHAARVDLQEWCAQLTRCAKKAGRSLLSIDILSPELDFPSFDQQHPLKLALCRV